MLDLQDRAVAKKKPDKKSTEQPDPQGAKWASKPIIVQLRGSEEFKAAVEEMAALDGNTVAGLVDRALRSYAREIAYGKPLPKR